MREGRREREREREREGGKEEEKERGRESSVLLFTRSSSLHCHGRQCRVCPLL